MITKNIPFSVKAVSDDGQFEGHGAIFGNVDRVGDIILPGAFKDTIPSFLESGIIAWQHDWKIPIGKPTKAYEDAKGLFIVASISDTAAGRDARTLMKDGVVRKLSIGYDVIEAEKLTAANIERFVNPSTVEPRHLEMAFMWGYALKKIELFEISPVSVPANPEADITGVKDGSGGRSLVDHSVAVLGAARDWIDRLDDVRELRESKGQELSEELKARGTALLDAIEMAKSKLEAIFDSEPELDLAEKNENALQLHAQFLDTERRILGAI